MIFTDDDLKRLDKIREEVSRPESTEDEKRQYDALEKELSSMDLDFLLR